VSGGCNGFDVTPITGEFAASSGGNNYYMTLCADDTAKCQGALCMKNQFEDQDYSLGTHASSQWKLNSSSDFSEGATVTITGGEDGWMCDNAGATVNVICGDGSDKLHVDAEGNTENCNGWRLTLNSKYICTLTPGSSGSGAKAGLSGGSIFLILFFVTAFVYFVGGVLFNKYRRGLSGVEMVPNIGFWRDLPGLVRDGCVFSWNKVRALCGGGRTGSLLSKGTGSTYETI